jgi:hypothetical protein
MCLLPLRQLFGFKKKLQSMRIYAIACFAMVKLLLFVSNLPMSNRGVNDILCGLGYMHWAPKLIWFS